MSCTRTNTLHINMHAHTCIHTCAATGSRPRTSMHGGRGASSQSVLVHTVDAGNSLQQMRMADCNRCILIVSFIYFDRSDIVHAKQVHHSMWYVAASLAPHPGVLLKRQGLFATRTAQACTAKHWQTQTQTQTRTRTHAKTRCRTRLKHSASN